MCNKLLPCKAEFAIGGMASTETHMVPPKEWSDAGGLRTNRFRSTAIEKDMTKKVGFWQVHRSVGDNSQDGVTGAMRVPWVRL